MAHPRPIDRQTFLEHIRQSGLLDAEQLTAVAVQLPEGAKSKHLARALVKQGLLTRFQAERLLLGRSTGFLIRQYCILDQLGRGGMGRVYKAEHRTMNRVVALKVLAPTLVQTERAQEMFLREARTAARLLHPNIVTAFDAAHVGDRCYLVMEYIDGPNLDQLVRKQGPLPVGQACEFLRQIAHGLQYAHVMGMVHRDIKPANILMQQGGEGRAGQAVVKISDFGLARLQETTAPSDEGMGTILTKENTVMGTPDFLSPEQARSLHNVDIRSDLYSLGCTFYFLLTGKVPYPGGNTLEKLIRHSTENAVPVEEIRPELPAGVVAIVNRLLQKSPNDRFQNPAELAAALEPFAATDPSAWKTARAASVPYEDEFATPVVLPAQNSAEVFELSASDEISALAGTMPMDFSPTPLSTTAFPSPSRLSHALGHGQGKRIRLALFCATLIVGGLVAIFSLIGMLLSR